MISQVASGDDIGRSYHTWTRTAGLCVIRGSGTWTAHPFRYTLSGLNPLRTFIAPATPTTPETSGRTAWSRTYRILWQWSALEGSIDEHRKIRDATSALWWVLAGLGVAGQVAGGGAGAGAVDSCWLAGSCEVLLWAGSTGRRARGGCAPLTPDASWGAARGWAGLEGSESQRSHLKPYRESSRAEAYEHGKELQNEHSFQKKNSRRFWWNLNSTRRWFSDPILIQIRMIIKTSEQGKIIETSERSLFYYFQSILMNYCKQLLTWRILQCSFIFLALIVRAFEIPLPPCRALSPLP